MKNRVARQEWPETLKRLNIDEQWQTDDSQNNYKDAAKPWRRCTHRRKEEEEETTRNDTDEEEETEDKWMREEENETMTDRKKNKDGEAIV